MTWERRVSNYCRQNGADYLTDAQDRRLIKKDRQLTGTDAGIWVWGGRRGRHKNKATVNRAHPSGRGPWL
jgi:hypothetical protein